MSPKDLQAIENIKWDPLAFPYDPASGWKKSSINVKNYGRMIHSSKVRFRFLHCQVLQDKITSGDQPSQPTRNEAVRPPVLIPKSTKVCEWVEKQRLNK